MPGMAEDSPAGVLVSSYTTLISRSMSPADKIKQFEVHDMAEDSPAGVLVRF